MTNLTTESHVLAFYGIQESLRCLKPVYEAVLNWLQTHDCPPNRLGVHGKGFSGKLVSFRRTDSRLQKLGFRDIEGISIASAPPEYDSQAIDGRMSADMSIRNEYTILAMDASIGDIEAMWDIARVVVARLGPCYGIGYTLERRKGPVFYALGLNYNRSGDKIVTCGPEYEEEVRISSWTDGMDQRVYREGLLRDVYPWNFLTTPHLTRRVADVSLRTWIEKDSKRGRLSPFEGETSLWSVDEAAIPVLRSELRNAGVIFDARLHAD